MASGQGFKKFINMLAFIGIVAVAAVLLLRLFLGEIFKVNSEVVNAIGLIAQCIAYLVTAVYAYFFIRNRGPAFIITYVIAVILIIILVAVNPI
ncbi:MAG: hypothetical protein PHV79_03750 [Clostridia bacterium]|jgi:hypothetical protein|nr:hypothetical protein [Clostridia bacterium]MDD3862944.1 hypothetical protein [Clostridia bacterium]MDD4408568.1 hypothetical protein [Clostridia bacterium]